MRKLLILIASVIVVSTAYSQQIVDTTKMWSILEEHCQPWGSVYSTDYYKFDGDTVIDDKEYMKVWISSDEFHETWNFFGAFIREENKKVYYREVFQEEGLIYDFNIAIGDTVVVNNSRGPVELALVLTEIDSVETSEGFRERWKLVSDVYEDAEYWIEGIGSESGVVNSGTGVFGSLCGLFYLLCESENEQNIYVNPEYELCWMYTTSIVEELPQQQLTIIDNGNNMSINSTLAGEKTVIVTTITGNKLFEKQTKENVIQINKSYFSSGVYIISVVGEKFRQSKKVIVR